MLALPQAINMLSHACNIVKHVNNIATNMACVKHASKLLAMLKHAIKMWKHANNNNNNNYNSMKTLLNATCKNDARNG